MGKWVLIVLMLCLGSPVHAVELKAGEMAPDYVGRDTSNNKILLSERRGKVIVVSFWATWCAPCLKELPILEGIQKQVSSDRLQVIAINYKQGRQAFYRIKEILKEASITLSSDNRDKVSRRYGVKGIPHTLVIDKEGKIAHIHIGYADTIIDTLVKELNVLLAS